MESSYMLGWMRRYQGGIRIAGLVAAMLFWGAAEAGAATGIPELSRLRSCLRKTGWATLLAGGTTVVVCALVNGAELVRVATGKGEEEIDGYEEDDPVRYTFDIRTEGGRDTLETSGEDMLWIYAEVLSNRLTAQTSRVTRGIEFKVEGAHADWVILGRPQMKGSMKAVRVKAEPPSEEASLSDDEVRIVVSATIAGRVYSAPVKLTLEEEAQLKITILE